MEVYVVGDKGSEHNHIESIHKTYEGALKVWNELRLKLLAYAKDALEDKEYTFKEMWERMVKNLECEDQDKINNYPWNTPYIDKREVVD